MYSVEKLRVGSVMSRLLVSISAGASRDSALRLMERSNLDMLPVVERGRLVGVVRLESLRLSTAKLLGASAQRPLYVKKDDEIDYAIKYMLENGLSRVPVVDSSIGMQCIGILSSSQLLKAKKSEKK